MFPFFLALYNRSQVSIVALWATCLNLLSDYCLRWKLKVNVSKTKILIFRKGGILPKNLSFTYEGEVFEIVKSFKYLGIVFTVVGSFSETQTTLAGQAQKAIFKLNICISLPIYYQSIN